METIAIPQGIKVEMKDNLLVVTGSGKTLEIPFNSKFTPVTVETNEVKFNLVGKATRAKVASMRSIIAHLNNAFTGISKGFSKKLQLVYSHFPVSIEVKGSQVTIKNFLGEKLPRAAKIIGTSKVEVKGQDITVSGHDKYAVGQTANNLVTATRITGKDRRVFQDGIYPVS